MSAIHRKQRAYRLTVLSTLLFDIFLFQYGWSYRPPAYFRQTVDVHHRFIVANGAAVFQYWGLVGHPTHVTLADLPLYGFAFDINSVAWNPRTESYALIAVPIWPPVLLFGIAPARFIFRRWRAILHDRGKRTPRVQRGFEPVMKQISAVAQHDHKEGS